MATRETAVEGPVQEADVALLKSLLTARRVLSLGVLAEGVPVLGLLPFAARPDLTGLVVHASRLARHTKGLHPGAPFAVLIHAEETSGVGPLQIPRVSLEGEVHALAPGTAGHASARALYVARFPSSEPAFGLGDFALYELGIRRGRLVGGFTRAIDLTQASLRQAAGT